MQMQSGIVISISNYTTCFACVGFVVLVACKTLASIVKEICNAKNQKEGDVLDG